MNRKSIYDLITDWSPGDTAIARTLGVKRQAVTAARKARGIPTVTTHGGKRPRAGRKAKKT